ncbi:guanylate kinase [Ignatzschineria sp. RMDPL8A]|uniref:guanylate kinase n=1 Tax=Ignatzschineria sp. RMDPL8A TaxID=2999236 RepID=UPI0024467B2F|nr:guanylate kinase [Ignatzschineria sp. RMDPL8A]MDG9728907.1 guanylate kinase [Ignatzschineria sp. RMDPL8A]
MDSIDERNRDGLGTLFVISSPSGGGKTTLVNQLIDQTDYVERVVTHTTRAPRAGEIDGEHYHFVSVEEFKALIEQDGFYEYAEVFGNYYGTSKKAVEAKTREGKDVVLVIDWQGAKSIKAIMPEAVLIFIMPPSLEILRARLIHRNLDSEAIVEKRMKDAVNQIKHYRSFDYVIVNDDFDLALSELKGIFHTNRLRLKYQVVKEAALLKSLFADEAE